MDTIPIPYLLDGATGTELIRRGMTAGVCTEQWVLDYPGVLVGLQREYVGVGTGPAGPHLWGQPDFVGGPRHSWQGGRV